MIAATAVHMVGGTRHEHIAEVRWRNLTTGDSGNSSRQQMVDWVRANPGQAVVDHGGHRAYVGIIDATPPYIRTYADGVWNDNLLALPRY